MKLKTQIVRSELSDFMHSGKATVWEVTLTEHDQIAWDKERLDLFMQGLKSVVAAIAGPTEEDENA